MGAVTKYVCDHCGKEIETKAKYPHVYALQLSCIDLKDRSASDVEFAVYMERPVPKDLLFCGRECFERWASLYVGGE